MKKLIDFYCNGRQFAKIIFLAALLHVFHEVDAQKKPNIVFILADDLGWMDCSINGSLYYETPNLERLAKRGMKFTNAYSASPLCSPTRSSILSGQYPHRFHLTQPRGHLPPNPKEQLMKKSAPAWQKVITPTSRTFMPLGKITIAERLKKNGYTTGFIGKWHLGHPPYMPENQGFDYNFAGGPQAGPRSYFSPYMRDNIPDGPPHEYLTDRITDEALRFIEQKKDSTFFLCLWEFGVHAPFQAKLDYVRQFENKVDPRGKQDNPIMAAMIKSLDESIGRVLDKLDALGLTENTLIVFFSDNGGNMYNVVDGKDATNNYPLRYGKGNIYEGGIRVPMVVSWKGKIPENTISDEVVSSIDFYPTLLKVAGTKPVKGQVLDGVNLLPVWMENKKLKSRPVFCHFPHYAPSASNFPSTSVRKGDWKLIRAYGEGPGLSDRYSLYNLKNDIGETRNLATDFPDKVKELNELIVKHVEETEGIFPVKNPNYNPDVPNKIGVKSIYPMERYPMFESIGNR